MRKTLAITALGSLLVWNAAAQNLVTNGGFEDPNLGSGWAPYTAGATTLTGWTVSGDGVQHFSTNIYPATGSQNLQMTADYSAAGTIGQTISTTPGAYYIMSLRVGSRNGAPVNGTARFGDTQHPFSLSGLGTTNVTNVTFTAAATGSSTTVEVTGGNPNGGSMLV